MMARGDARVTRSNPGAALRVAATATVLVSALVIVLVVLPTSRRAFRAA